MPAATAEGLGGFSRGGNPAPVTSMRNCSNEVSAVVPCAVHRPAKCVETQLRQPCRRKFASSGERQNGKTNAACLRGLQGIQEYARKSIRTRRSQGRLPLLRLGVANSTN